MNISLHKKWAALFGLWALHGVVALWQFFSMSGGFSLQRMTMGGIVFAWILFTFILIISTLRQARWLVNLLEIAQRPSARDCFFTFAVFAIVVRIWIAILQGLFAAAGNLKYSGYFTRFNPLLDLVFFIAAEAAALLLFFTFRNWQTQEDVIRIFIRRLGIVLLVLALASLFIHVSGWGVVPGYKGDWSRGIPAVALLEWQIILACIVSVGMILFEAKYSALKNLDLWICIAVWLLATTLWLSQPIIPSSAALAPHEPNFEIYPFNDAQIYDGYAQSAMIGNGYGADMIPQRPLYIVMLVVMHGIVGQNYNSVIFLQSLLLAFFPVLLYLFGKEFFGRPIGIAVALLAILRDITSNIAAPFTGNLSYTKLYLSEIPTAMMLILFLLIGIRWIKRGFPLFYGFMLGGLLGIGILIRTQVAVAFPVLILFALLIRPKLILPALKSAALGVVAIALVVAPWFARNWRMTGQLLFDNPGSQTANLALRYSRLNGKMADITQQPGESNADYNNRMLVIAKEAFNKNPSAVGREVASAFINHGINNILLMPLRYNLETFDELWSPTKAFWEQWHGTENLAQSLLLGFYIFLFGLGLTVAWQRLGWLGFLPLGVNLAYNLWTSIALLSGQRFMLTMDWSAYMYYMLGLFALISAFLFTLEHGRDLIRFWYRQNQLVYDEPYHGAHGDHRGLKNNLSVSSVTSVVKDDARWQKHFVWGVLFFAVGASLWVTELVFPQRYPLVSQSQLVSKVVSAPGFNLDRACFQNMLAKNNLKLAQGRALYPRYYAAGDGETFTDAHGYKRAKTGRLVFEMIGQINTRIIFPISNETDFFPTAADVTLGVDVNNQPWFVLVEQGNQSQFYLADVADKSACR